MSADKEIVIDTGDETPIKVSLSTNPTVGELKRLIGERRGDVPPPYILRAGATVLADDVRLSETPFANGDVKLTFVESLPRREAIIRVPDGRFAKTRYSKGTTVRKAVQEISSVLKFTHPSDFIVIVNGEEVPPDSKIVDLDLQADNVIRIEDPPREVKVVYQTPSGKRRVAASRYRGIATVATVRERLAAAFGVELAQSALFLGDSALPDNAALADISIPADGALELKSGLDLSSLEYATINTTNDVGSLSPVRKVGFRTPTKRVKAHFRPTATVRRAKEKLAAELEVEPQQLWVSKVGSDDELLGEAEIVSNDELVVHVYKPVTLKLPGNKSARARYAETATVKSTKEKLAGIVGVPPEEISLELDYSDEDTRLEDLKIAGVIVVKEKIPEDDFLEITPSASRDVAVADKSDEVEDVADEAGEAVVSEPPAEAVISEPPAEAVVDEAPAVVSEPPAEAVVSEPPAEAVVSEPPAEAVISEPPAEAVVDEAPAVVSEPPAEAVVSEPPAEAVVSEPPAEAVVSEPPAEAVVSEPPAEAVVSEPPAEAVVSEPPAEAVVSEPPAEAVISEPPAEAVVDEAPAVVSEPPAEAVVSEPPAEAVVSEPPAEAVIDEAPAEDGGAAGDVVDQAIEKADQGDDVPPPAPPAVEEEEEEPEPIADAPPEASKSDSGSGEQKSDDAAPEPGADEADAAETRRRLQKGDVLIVKLRFPIGQTWKFAYRKKAVIAQVRAVAATELNVPVDKIVLTFQGTELGDATLISQLQVPATRRIKVSVLD